MQFFSSSVGRKIMMALTGIALTMFIIIHLLGNSSVLGGREWINAYADSLHSIPSLVWIFRLVMAVIFFTHIYFGIVLTLENQSSKPQKYALQVNQKATFASKNMIWTGLAIFTFLIYHLLHFTLQVTSPEIGAMKNLDYKGRADVFLMLTNSFAHTGVLMIYVIACVMLTLHLYHGIQSSFQTLGIMSSKMFDRFLSNLRLVALAIGTAYIILPIAVFIGIIGK